MKKQHLMALAIAAAVSSMASTGFAASSNPFDDVPADHWAYGAVSQLAKDGVIEGYGDNTFNGSKNITRYEMAQMVAKAMSKSNKQPVSNGDKELINKLEEEFGDELNNLGVRVANLEKSRDNLKWSGMFAQKYQKQYHKGRLNQESPWWEKEFDLNASATVPGSGWQVHGNFVNKWGSGDGNGFNSEETFDDDYGGSTQSSDFHLDKIWAEGNLGRTGQYMKFGQFQPWVQNGFVTDADIKGASLEHYGSNYATHLFAGRLHAKYWDLGLEDNVPYVNHGNYGDFIRNGGMSDTGYIGQDPVTYDWIGKSKDTHKDIWGAVYDHTFSKKFNASAGYYHYKSNAYKNDALQIGAAVLNYKLMRNLNLEGMYARGNQDGHNNAWNVELQFRGNPWIPADRLHLFSAYLGYRYLAPDALIKSNFGDGADEGQKGLEVGMFYNVLKNCQLSCKFFQGHSITNNNQKRSKFYSSIAWNF